MIRAEVNQTLLPSRWRVSPRWLQTLLNVAARILRLRSAGSLSLAFVDHRAMRRLNRSYRGKDRVTDLLSFGGRKDQKFLGELLIAWPYARRQAKARGKTWEEELALLIAHGLLHLRGYDHETKKESRVMFSLQDKILKQFFYARS
ncbi:rRNA maturation RNase YbeY [Candidatus Uhrbacteria bacterium]|nr:rRNA maturation RNase YbeY [Candidatus Uhrbacteria bacterium]